MITTLSIIEDDKRFSDILKQVIIDANDIKCISSYGNAALARKSIIEDNPDIVLMDIQLPDATGIDLVREFRLQNKEMKFIMFTSFDDDERVFESLRSGANGYIIKSDDLTNILKAIFEVISGGAPMSKKIAQKVIKHFHRKDEQQEKLNTLTTREKEILNQLAEGLYYKEVAHKLDIAQETVKKHAGNIYRKLHVNNRVEAANILNNKK